MYSKDTRREEVEMDKKGMKQQSKFAFKTKCPWCSFINKYASGFADQDQETGQWSISNIKCQCHICHGFYECKFNVEKNTLDSKKDIECGPYDDVCNICENSKDDDYECYKNCEARKRGRKK